MSSTEHPEPVKGMPATIHLYSDTLAAVVVRVNRRSVSVARVATTEEPRRINAEGEPYPVMAYEGILDRVEGEPERYVRFDTPDGPVFRNGTVGLTLGRSVRIVDYRV